MIRDPRQHFPRQRSDWRYDNANVLSLSVLLALFRPIMRSASLPALLRAFDCQRRIPAENYEDKQPRSECKCIDVPNGSHGEIIGQLLLLLDNRGCTPQFVNDKRPSRWSIDSLSDKCSNRIEPATSTLDKATTFPSLSVFIYATVRR